MAHSLEGRFPFLDKRIIEVASKIPERYKINNNITKWILKEAVAGKLPEKIINRQKMGFTVPVNVMLQKMKPIIIETCYEAKMSSLNTVLNIDAIIYYALKFYSGDRTIPLMQVWSNFILLYWFVRVFPEFKRA